MAHDLEVPFLRLDSLTAADIMTTDVVTAREQESVVMAGYLMQQANVHHLPVLEHQRVVGMVDEVALVESVSHLSWGELQHPVGAIMRRDVVRVHPDTPLRDVAVHLGYSRSGAVVVTDDNRLVGLVTCRDVVDAVARSQPSAPAVTAPRDTAGAR